MFAFAKQLVKSAEGIIALADDSSSDNILSKNQSSPSYGFRVIHVRQNSPAIDAGIESLFDFIIGINGHELVPQPIYDDSLEDSSQSGIHRDRFNNQSSIISTSTEASPIKPFIQEIVNCKGRSVSFQIWTAKGRVQRTVMLEIPADATMSDKSFGLGITLQWSPLDVADHVWHVLNVAANSPAEEAGLISHADYIVGAEGGALEIGGEGLLSRVVSRICAEFYNQPAEKRAGRSPPEIELYVYNHDYDTLRPVSIRPNPNWGGSGLLGCGVGYGLLHRLPLVVGKYPDAIRVSLSQSRNSPTAKRRHAPGDTLFDAQEDESQLSYQEKSSDLITPADLEQAAPHLQPPLMNKSQHRSRRHSNYSNKPDLSEYFAEEERKSKEVDIQSSNSAVTDLPPPPKMK